MTHDVSHILTAHTITDTQARKHCRGTEFVFFHFQERVMHTLLIILMQTSASHHSRVPSPTLSRPQPATIEQMKLVAHNTRV